MHDASCCLAEKRLNMAKEFCLGDPGYKVKLWEARIAGEYIDFLSDVANGRLPYDSFSQDEINCVIEDLGKIMCKCYTPETVQPRYCYILTNTGLVIGMSQTFPSLNGGSVGIQYQPCAGGIDLHNNIDAASLI